jgi:hypothetical protein
MEKKENMYLHTTNNYIHTQERASVSDKATLQDLDFLDGFVVLEYQNGKVYLKGGY